MELRHLKYFLAVSEDLNIGRAAARLHLSQPPLTRQIHALEQYLGVELFVRTAKGVELTQAGEIFKDEAANILMLIEGAVDRVKRAGAGKLGRLDVAYFGSGIYDTIPKLLREFHDKVPDVRIVLHSMNKDEQIEALLQRRITVAFNRLTLAHPGIGRELVAMERLVAVLPSGHPLAACEAVSIRDLASSPLVLFPNVGRPNFVDHVRQLFKQQGFEPVIAQEVGDAVTGLALVGNGFGVTLAPESTCKSLHIDGTTMRNLSDAPNAVVDLSCLYRASDQSPLLQSFLSLVREYRHASER